MSKPQMWRLVTRLFIPQRLSEDDNDDEARPLAESLLLAIADLLFCPDFTAQSNKKNNPVSPPSSGTHVWQTFVSRCSQTQTPDKIQNSIREICQSVASGLFLYLERLSVKHWCCLEELSTLCYVCFFSFLFFPRRVVTASLGSPSCS